MKVNYERLPPLRFDCGTDDPLIEANRELHRALTRMDVRHEYQEFPGGHDWPYWTEHVRQTLAFCKTVLIRVTTYFAAPAADAGIGIRTIFGK